MTWTHTYGHRGCKVVARELPGGWMQLDIHVEGTRTRRRLGHQDRKRARQEAKRVYADLQQGVATLTAPTLDRILGLYLLHRTPRKRSATSRAHDERCAAMWLAALGKATRPTAITTRQWDTVIQKRRSGARDARWAYVKPDKRRPVGDRTLEADCRWLVQVCGWATNYRDETGRYLLPDNPLRGFEVPSEANPKRPIVTRAWMTKVLTAAGPTPLQAMLTVADTHGRRIGAIRHLRASDILWEHPSYQHGALRYRKEHDKSAHDWVVPMSAPLRAELERHVAALSVIGDAWLFPAPGRPGRPVSKDRARDWLKAAIATAKVTKYEGTVWHAIRRLWVTEHGELPLKERMYVAGYVDRQTMEAIYQQADPGALQRTVNGRREYGGS